MTTSEWRRFLSSRLSIIVLVIIIVQLSITYTFKALNPLIISLVVLGVSVFLVLLFLNGIINKLLVMIEETNHQSVINERKRLGREFHDGIIQDINYLELKLKLLEGNLKKRVLDELTLEEVKYIKDYAIELNANARVELFKLRNISSDDLNKFLVDYLNYFSKKYSINYHLNSPTSPIRLKSEAINNIFKIIQEVLTNSQKHGQAKNINVNLTLQNNSLRIAINDDGISFDPSSVISQDSHGLAIIKERIQELNGKFEIESHLGEGTSIKLMVPLR